MKLPFSLLLVLSSLASISTLAQSAHSPKVPEEVDTAHDLPQNDPSKGPQLTLKKSVPQKKAMIDRLLVRAGEKIVPNFEAERPSYASVWQNIPEAFDRLRLHQFRYAPNVESGMTLVNADHEFKGISDRAFGLCWGFATLQRNFSVLAFFDPSLTKGVPGNPNYEEWLDFYRAKIDRIAAGRATLIPGFSNLRELSQVPELELYLKAVTIKLWASRAVHASSIKILKHSTDWMTFDDVEDLLKKLEKRLARGEYPKIIFSSLIPSKKVMGANADIHAVLVHRVVRGPNHTAQILLWDINFYAETQLREPKFIQVTPEHGLTYAPWYEPTQPYAKGSDLLARVNFAPENDQETADQVLELKRFCTARATEKYCR